MGRSWVYETQRFTGGTGTAPRAGDGVVGRGMVASRDCPAFRRDAGGGVAVVAPEDREVALNLGKSAVFLVLDPCAKVADGDIVLGFARASAGVATEAAVGSGGKAVRQVRAV